mmetsp:Transcript_19075/g.26662  ORF Transcript_19075/g.26662 Transcript_19075/m.26662 type:complete len:325 (-) Transcript_19075:401-1375(-)|eukprot:CAMPEP_0184481984 /NCGR_PEP_ID=MMETSP0113_2-20130426/3572_1 /TAXON_ID=91329 /ORGANISM="Norrisiella sphaerica, Strain BC52" /LENGTH=324 /DNA_ID=CAMNT_0026861483 /DNA_START=116 /DNA_END=1090 /DNA_ORIENTATION=-
MGAACSAERYDVSPTANPREGKAQGPADGRDIYLVTVPQGASPGQQLLINTAQGAMRVQIPPGIGPGQQFRASVPRTTSTVQRGGALSAIPVDNPFQNQPMIRAFEVRGAGSAIVNGIYQAQQQVDGVQAYRKVGTNIMLHRYPNSGGSGSSVWWIADWGAGRRPADGDDTDYYFNNSQLPVPPQNGWRLDNACQGAHPAPIVVPHGTHIQSYEIYRQQQPLRSARGGAPIQIIRSLPESKYKSKMIKKTDADGKEKEIATPETCCICLSEFKDGESIVRLPCLHIFHTEEISKWLMKSHKCPLCNTSVLQGFMAMEGIEEKGA